MPGNPLDIFGSVLGKCFVFAFSPGLEDEHCYFPVYDGAHVRDVHVVSNHGRPVYKGETTFSRTPEGLVFTYVNDRGGAGTGRAAVANGAMALTLEMRGDPAAAPQTFRRIWRPSEEGYELRGEGQAPQVFRRVR